MTRSVSFVGPLPPPLNGFSNVCAMMLGRLSGRMPVEVFNRAPGSRAQSLGLMRQLINPAKYLATCLGRRDAILYLALSGGRGQFIDLLYVLISKLLRRPVFVHHHSFVYINAPTWFNRCLFALLRRETHIVLSPHMGRCLAQAYGLRADAVKVVSNAAFYEADADPREFGNDSIPLSLGFLSNITVEKGIVEFFEILKKLQLRKVKYRAQIAGPVSPGTERLFADLLRAASNVEYRGPLYGAEKDAFYRGLDIFIFPTNYANEAEPLVIYEALRQGVYVLACDRGSIAEMLGNGAGLALAHDQMVDASAQSIERFDTDRSALWAAQALAKQQAQRIQASGRSELENLLVSMEEGESLAQGMQP